MLSQKGSSTIEAAIWIPVLLSVFLLSLKTGLSIYSEIVHTGYSNQVKQMDMIQEFYNYQVLGEIIQEETDD